MTILTRLTWWNIKQFETNSVVHVDKFHMQIFDSVPHSNGVRIFADRLFIWAVCTVLVYIIELDHLYIKQFRVQFLEGLKYVWWW